MWTCLSLLLTLCLLHGGGAESEGGGPRCQLPPAWKIGEVEPMKGSMGRVTVVTLLQASWLFCLVQASRMEGLRQTLESQGLRDVAYMVINHQGEQAQRLHPMLAQRLPEGVTLYKQDGQQPDIWQSLGGEKDDFLIYDRCGRLTHHISLPYSIIGHGHIENAIKDTYCKHICGECSYETAETPEECKPKADAQPDGDGSPAGGDATQRDHSHHGHHGQHGHHGHHGHNRHGDNQFFHPRGFGRGHDNNHGHHHHGNHDSAAHGSDFGQGQSQQGLGSEGHNHHNGASQSQHHLDSDQMQQAVHIQEMTQRAQGAPTRPWVTETGRWKSKFSWQWTAGSDNEASPKASWCWHWRRLFGDAGSEQSLGLWHCDEALPASCQWQGLMGDAVYNVRETWQWRLPPAAWQQPQTAQWAWPPGVVSWGWQQL